MGQDESSGRSDSQADSAGSIHVARSTKERAASAIISEISSAAVWRYRRAVAVQRLTERSIYLYSPLSFSHWSVSSSSSSFCDGGFRAFLSQYGIRSMPSIGACPFVSFDFI